MKIQLIQYIYIYITPSLLFLSGQLNETGNHFIFMYSYISGKKNMGEKQYSLLRFGVKNSV